MFASLLNCCQLLKEEICFFKSKFFPLKVDPILYGFCHPMTSKGSHKTCIPLEHLQKNMEIFSYT